LVVRHIVLPSIDGTIRIACLPLTMSASWHVQRTSPLTGNQYPQKRSGFYRHLNPYIQYLYVLLYVPI
jgi:hypothetical protein